jgi:hypothetical protein
VSEPRVSLKEKLTVKKYELTVSLICILFLFFYNLNLTNRQEEEKNLTNKIDNVDKVLKSPQSLMVTLSGLFLMIDCLTRL